jgi:hypothetical protein
MTLNLPESSSIAHMSGQVPTEAMHGSRRTVPANPPTEVRTWAKSSVGQYLDNTGWFIGHGLMMTSAR